MTAIVIRATAVKEHEVSVGGPWNDRKKPARYACSGLASSMMKFGISSSTA